MKRQAEALTVSLQLARGAHILAETRALIHDANQDTHYIQYAYDAIYQCVQKCTNAEFADRSEMAGFIAMLFTKFFLASHKKSSLNSALRFNQERLNDGLPTVEVDFEQL